MTANPQIQIRPSARSRHLSLAVYRDGSVVLTAPQRAEQSRIKQFLVEKMPWIQKKLAFFLRQSARPVLTVQPEAVRGHRLMAQELVKSRLEYFNHRYQLTYHRVTIKYQKTRWGSCSQKGNLNFNYKIALLPSSLADYLVVHELCHLQEMNHSKRFWNLVAITIPDYRDCRRKLKQIRLH